MSSFRVSPEIFGQTGPGWRLQHMLIAPCLALLIACQLVPTLWQPHQGSNSLEAKLWWYCWWFVRNLTRKPVEVGSLSHYLQGFISFYTSQVVQDFFHQQYTMSMICLAIWKWFTWIQPNIAGSPPSSNGFLIPKKWWSNLPSWRWDLIPVFIKLTSPVVEDFRNEPFLTAVLWGPILGVSS